MMVLPLPGFTCTVDGVEQVTEDIKEARKYIRDGVMYIDRNGKTYTIVGTEVE